jgi:hypothetical protein
MYAAAVTAAVLAVEAAAQNAQPGPQASEGWLLLAPPAVAEKRALMKVYSAGSDAEVQAAVATLPDDDQIRLVSKIYEILTIPTLAGRTEALLDALQDHSAPVARWRLVDTFESAASCESQRQHALQKFEHAAARVRSSSPDSEELAFEDWTIFEGLAACRVSRCVPESALLVR